jgi:Ran GTPase-activating protein (RanGAP) involved in mRNA processing and transport
MQSLNLSWNGLESQGATAVFKALADNKGLISLNVASTRTSNASCVHLAAAIRQNATLERLIVSNNGIGFEAEQLLVQSLAVNRTLNHLDLKVREHCCPAFAGCSTFFGYWQQPAEFLHGSFDCSQLENLANFQNKR